MTQIPHPVSNFLATITVPGAFAQATGFKVMAAVRLKLAELAQLPGNPLLNADELDDAATGCRPQINAPLTEQDIDYLATQLATAYFELTRSFEQAGFGNPTRMANKIMQSFTLTF